MDLLVSVDWLAEHMGDGDVRVFDATIRVDKVLFVLLARNGRRVAIYDGGLTEWCADRSLPLEVGE